VEWRRKYKPEINDGEFPSTSTTSETNIFPKDQSYFHLLHKIDCKCLNNIYHSLFSLLFVVVVFIFIQKKLFSFVFVATFQY